MNDELEQQNQLAAETFVSKNSIETLEQTATNLEKTGSVTLSTNELEDIREEIKEVEVEVLQDFPSANVNILNVIEGTEGDDVAIVGTNEPDQIFGLGGNDGIFSLNGNDTVFGGFWR